MEDKTLTCRDCGREFTFTSGEQAFYQEKGFENEPTRCPECRSAQKRRRSFNSRGGGGPRKLYDVVCASCGKGTQVPFEPSQGRPVLCKECFTQSRAR